MKNTLKSSEWFLATALLVFVASLVLIAKINASRASSSIALASFQQEEILVTIDGAVKKPGTYSIKAGTTLEQALKKARPGMEANLRVLPLKMIVDEPMHVQVESLKEIKVKVKGAIAEPVEIVLPSNSRISDLKSKVVFTPETDKAFFRRRKTLKDGDEIEVPKKTVELN